MTRDFTERYFLIDYRYILKNLFYFVNVPDYCFKPLLSRIACVNSFVKVYEDLSMHHRFARVLFTERKKQFL